jgi:hypothetical protein
MLTRAAHGCYRRLVNSLQVLFPQFEVCVEIGTSLQQAGAC